MSDNDQHQYQVVSDRVVYVHTEVVDHHGQSGSAFRRHRQQVGNCCLMNASDHFCDYRQ